MKNILKFIDMLEYFVNYDIENWIELDHNYFEYQHVYNSNNNKISILLGAENSFLLRYDNEIIVKHLASTDEAINENDLLDKEMRQLYQDISDIASRREIKEQREKRNNICKNFLDGLKDE